MLTLFRNGGWGMYPILLIGFLALGTGAYFAFRADPRLRGFLDSILKSIFWFTVGAFASDVMTVFFYLTHDKIEDSQLTRILYEGLGESLSPVLMGSAFLALTHVLIAIGQRRVDAKLA